MTPQRHFSLVPLAKISDSMYGQVLQCEMQYTPVSSAATTIADIPLPTTVVAVKSMSLKRTKKLAQLSDRTIDDPVQEVRVASLLIASGGHVNVVQPLCHFRELDTLFVVFEFCRDGDLHDFLLASAEVVDNCVSEHESLFLMRQILRGVQFLHQSGIAHRDLSLENVLLDDGVCKVSDFGLSTDASRRCIECVGKEYYMAPEVVVQAYSNIGITDNVNAFTADKAYDPVKADVWSLGVMWFVLLTGMPLVEIALPNDRVLSAIAKHGVGVVFRAWGLTSTTSTEMIELLSHMLQIDPKKRISIDQVLAHPLLQALDEIDAI